MKKETSKIAELHFFPCIEYVAHIHQSQQFIIEANESFQKQSYRNRCVVLGPNSLQSLIIPINHDKGRNSILTTRINYNENWLQVFWRSLEAAYRRSPYFDYFEMMFRPILFSKEEYLFKMNFDILKACLQFLSITTEIKISDTYIPNYPDTLDLRNKIHPKQKNQTFLTQEYPQCFGTTFQQNLSIIDLMMNEGPAGLTILNQVSFGT